jgi:hypothetical protein
MLKSMLYSFKERKREKKIHATPSFALLFFEDITQMGNPGAAIRI